MANEEEHLAATRRLCELQNLPLGKLDQFAAIKAKEPPRLRPANCLAIADSDEYHYANNDKRALAEQYLNQQMALRQMHSFKQAVLEDLRRKTEAAEIDAACG